MKPSFKNVTLFSFVSFLLLMGTRISISLAQLKHNYYQDTCPNVESIVRDAVRKKLNEAPVSSAATLRLFFHDCFVRGCDGSVILASPTNRAEKDSEIGRTLAGDGFDTVIRAKAAVDSVPACKNRVSCADILAMAARDTVALSGGPDFLVELGRRDGRISTASSVSKHLPVADFNYKQLKSLFAKNGLGEVDLIALSGGHTLGFCHCNQFANRIYNFTKSKNGIDPSLDPEYAKLLRQICHNQNPGAVAALDFITPLGLDNNYYKNILQGKALLTSDQTLLSTMESRRLVTRFAEDDELFKRIFAAAMIRLGRVGVKTGNQGEVHIDCTKVN